MIRDEFKNDTKQQTEQKIKNKKQSVQDRAYYAKKISKLNDLFGPVKFSTICCLVCFLLAGAAYLLTLIFVPETDIGVMGRVVIIGAGAFVVWAVAWFAFIVTHLKRKIAEYKQKLTEISAAYVDRYSKINKK